MQIVLARFEFDMPGFTGKPGAERMDVFTMGLQQPRHGILRQPVDLQIGM